ncbi:unnamed protein product [Lathyrus sativus]|nr:unnamed protein product [Lathyrus sativus]
MSAVRFSHSSIEGYFNFQNVQNYHHHPNRVLNLARVSSFSIDLSSRCYSKGKLASVSGERGFKAVFDSRFSRVCFRRSVELSNVALMSRVLDCRMYSSSLGGKGSGDGATEVAASDNGGGDSVVSGDLVERVKDMWKTVAETASYVGEMIKETSDGGGGDVLSGLFMQFSKPFSIGDTIKAGSIEGQVLEIGLTSTSLLSPEKLPVIVPNSFFSNQVIVNKSRVDFLAIITKIPLQIEDLSKIPQISNDVKSMLTSNAKVFLGKDVPYCFLSRIESSFAELTLGYNLKHMRKHENYAAQQDILLQAVQVIKNNGASLGSTWNGTK